MEPLSSGHLGTNINSSSLSTVERLSTLRGSIHIILIGVKFGDLVLSIVESYLIQCPFFGRSSLRGSTVFIYIFRLDFPFFSYLVCNYFF